MSLQYEYTAWGFLWAAAFTLVSCSVDGGQQSERSPSDAGVPDARDAVEVGDADAAGDTAADTRPRLHGDVGPGDECTEIGDCRRGFFCSGSSCSAMTGCAVFGVPRRYEDETGCLLVPGGGLVTAAECETDEDCENVPYGFHCAKRVCHSEPPCEDDEDCEREDRECYSSSICVAKDAGY